MNRDLQRDFDLINGECDYLSFGQKASTLLTDLPGSDDNYYRVGLLNTSPYYLEPYFGKTDRLEIQKPIALLPGSLAPSDSHTKDCKDPEKCSCLIEKQMKQEGFGSSPTEPKIEPSTKIEGKIDSDILNAMKSATVKTSRISVKERFPKANNSSGEVNNAKKRKVDMRDKFRFVN